LFSEQASGERAELLGVRWPVALPETEMDAVDGLAPAEPESEPEQGDAASAAADDANAPADDANAPTDSAAQEKKDDDAVARNIAAAPPPSTGDGAGEEMPPDRPNKPVLAAVAIGGAVVLAVPILLIGTGSHHAKKQPTAAGAGTLLPGDGQQPPGAFVSSTPTPIPSPSASKNDTAKAKNASPSAKPSASVPALGEIVPNKRPSSSAPSRLVIHAPRDIYPGRTVRTNRIALTMQADGDLVLRDRSNKIIWSSGTHGRGVYAAFQTDGNLVLYTAGRKVVWAAGSSGHHNSTLVLQSNYNMVIIAHDGYHVWATGTNR
jgi:hypothetical protein